MRTFRIYSLNNFQVYRIAVLTVVSMLCTHPQDLQQEVCTFKKIKSLYKVAIEVGWTEVAGIPKHLGKNPGDLDTIPFPLTQFTDYMYLYM